jgi:hypothetical protein
MPEPERLNSLRRPAMRKVNRTEVILVAILIAVLFLYYRRGTDAGWPRDNVRRFVRTHIKDAPPRVTILWPTNNTLASGSIKIVVDATNDSCISSLTLVVDGKDWFTLTDGPMVFVLPTDYFTNGVHTIVARAYDKAGNPRWGGNPRSDVVANEGTSPPLHVVFRNVITTEWQPVFGTRLPIRASLMYPDADWSVYIKTKDETILRTISGIATNGKIDVVWDSKDDCGNDVPADAHYFITITATPLGDSAQTVEDTRAPAVPPVEPRPDPPWCTTR